MPNNQSNFSDGWYERTIEDAKKTVNSFSAADKSWAENIQKSIQGSSPIEEPKPVKE